jgi:aspartyl-tRNA synthetase
VKAIVAPGLGGASRKEIDELTERAKRFGAKGLVWLAVEETGAVRSSILKFLGDDGAEQSSPTPARAPATSSSSWPTTPT